MALTKVAGDILDPGIVVAGIVTATGFSGPFSGGTDGSFSGNVTVGGNLTVNGDYTTLNTTLREVEILRVDTNSSTAAGIITQTGSGDILKLFDNTTEVFKVADGGNLTVTGQTTIAHTASPQLILKDSDTSGVGDSNGISLQDSGGTEYGFIGQASTGDHSLHVATKSTTNPVRIQVNGTTRLEAGNSGVYVTGVLDVAAGGDSSLRGDVYIPDKIIHLGDDNTAIRFPADDTVSVETAGQQNVQVTGTRTRLTSPSGTNTTVRLQHQGNSGYGDIILDRQVNAFIIDNDPSNASNNQSYFSVKNKGNTNLYVKNDGKVGINTTTPYSALEVQGDGGTNDATITFTRWGTPGNGGVIGSNFYRIGTDSVAGIGAYRESAMDDAYLAFHTQPTGGNYTERLRITSTGEVRIPTGSNSTSRLTFGGGVNIYHDNNFKIENATGYLKLQSSNNLYIDGAELFFRNAGGTNRWKIDSSGHFIPGTAGAVNIGSASAEIGDVFLATDKALKLGNSQIGDLFVDSSNVLYLRNSTGQTVIRAASDIYISDYAGNHRAGFRDNSAVDLYFDIENHSTAKLSTTATGVSVHGEVAASQDYPNFRPTLDLNFAAVKKLDPRITYERTGPASYVDENGLVRFVGANTPRFDHDPLTGECRGLLMEESRINKFASSDPGHSVWVIDGDGTKDVNTTETKDPAGTYTACKLISSDAANSYSQIWDNLSIGSGGVQSFWAKKGTHNVIGIFDFSGGGGVRAWFDLNTGEHRCEGGSKVAAGVQSNGNDTNNSNMVEYLNGWYRCIYYEAANMTYNHTRIVDFDSDTKASASSDSIYMWGMQAETGVSCATSLIPADTGLMPGTVTRGGDTAFIDGQDFTDAYNVSEGTFILKQSVDDTSTSNQWGWGVEKSGNRGGFLQGLGFRVGGGGAGYVGAWYVNNGSQQAFFNMNAGALVNIPFVSALAYKVNDMAATTSGMTVATDTSASIADAGEFDRFTLGTYHYDTMSTGHIQRVMYYKKRLPNNQLVTLTS